MAASTSAIERSAVFIVPMMIEFFGSVKRLVVRRSTAGRSPRSRYSSRKYSSPKTLARLPRLISSMIRTCGCSGFVGGLVDEPRAAARACSANATARRPADRPVALEEVLVGVRRVELHELDVRPVRPGAAASSLGDVGLSGPGRPVEDQLRPVPQQLDAFLQPVQRHMQPLASSWLASGRCRLAVPVVGRRRSASASRVSRCWLRSSTSP